MVVNESIIGKEVICTTKNELFNRYFTFNKCYTVIDILHGNSLKLMSDRNELNWTASSHFVLKEKYLLNERKHKINKIKETLFIKTLLNESISNSELTEIEKKKIIINILNKLEENGFKITKQI